MGFLRVSVSALVSWSLACGGSAPPAKLSSTWVAPSLLAHVPADSPYVVASLAQVNEATRRRVMAGLETRMRKGLAQLQTTMGIEAGKMAPWLRALGAVADELKGKDPVTWSRELGFDPEGRFVLYGLSLWPVVRAEVAQPARLRKVIERALAAAGAKPRQEVFEGRSYWIAGTAEISVVAAVMDREAVIAVLPTAAVAAALPEVIGTRAPKRSLNDTTTVADLFARYRLMGYLFTYVDTRNLVGIATGQLTSEVDGPLRQWIGAVPPVCRADLERLAAVMPRFVLGYHRIDEVGYDGLAVFETSPGVASGLMRLHAAAPEVTTPMARGPLFAMGAAIEPDAVMAWMRGVAGDLRARPFGCPWLEPLNKVGTELAKAAGQPLPAVLRGVHGLSVVVDRATLSPMNLDGHVLVAGDLAADLLSTLSGAVPAIAGVTPKRDGRPVAIPVQRLGLPVSSAHVAVSADRVVIAGGADSAREATAHLASPVPKASPLFVMAADGPRLQKLLAATGEENADAFGYLGEFEMSLDAVAEGVRFDVRGTWAPVVANTP